MADDSSELIPHHEPRRLPDDGKWQLWSYRGATVRGLGMTNYLHMEGHPLDGRTIGHPDSWFPIIDYWVHHQALPKPFIWPLPARKPA
jgi:hypothetical protein